MGDIVTLLIILALWLAINRWLLPKLGVPT